ncbi:MAG: SGNH/GDSL hydrolase family protein [Candidatus Bathyarchaeota archaeon]|nr:SGNH/GDSL hydrolase family protein [Candidatus Bathyarchaeota archaeon]
MSDWIVTVFLGDSLTTGFQQGPGYFPPRYYPFTNMLESALRRQLTSLGSERDLVIVNQGMDGDSTGGMLHRFKSSVAPENPDVVLIWGGINDLTSRHPPEDIFPIIVDLLENTQAINAVPILLNVAPVAGPHFNETIMELNELTENYCNEHGVRFVDVFKLLVDDEGKLADEFSNDGVHLSIRAYQKLIPVLFNVIMESISELI